MTRQTDGRCIRIKGFGSGTGSGSFIPRNGSSDPDQYQNETDPKHLEIPRKISSHIIQHLNFKTFQQKPQI